MQTQPQAEWHRVRAMNRGGDCSNGDGSYNSNKSELIDSLQSGSYH